MRAFDFDSLPINHNIGVLWNGTRTYVLQLSEFNISDSADNVLCDEASQMTFFKCLLLCSWVSLKCLVYSFVPLTYSVRETVRKFLLQSTNFWPWLSAKTNYVPAR